MAASCTAWHVRLAREVDRARLDGRLRSAGLPFFLSRDLPPEGQQGTSMWHAEISRDADDVHKHGV
jgi:hypothetical protein